MGISAVSLLSTWLNTNRKTNCKSGWAGCAQRLITSRAVRPPARECVCQCVSALCHGYKPEQRAVISLAILGDARARAGVGRLSWWSLGRMLIQIQFSACLPGSLFVTLLTIIKPALLMLRVVNIKSHARNISHPPSHPPWCFCISLCALHTHIWPKTTTSLCARAPGNLIRIKSLSERDT